MEGMEGGGRVFLRLLKDVLMTRAHIFMDSPQADSGQDITSSHHDVLSVILPSITLVGQIPVIILLL